MSVYLKTSSPYYHYDFVHLGERYHGSTVMKDLEAARAFEANLKLQVKGDAPDRASNRTRAQRLVYVIQGEKTGLVKIGSTLDVSQRLAAHQCGSPDRLCVLWSGAGGSKAESAAHRALIASRSHGEWYRPTTAVLRLIDIACATDDIYAAILEAVRWRDAA